MAKGIPLSRLAFVALVVLLPISARAAGTVTRTAAESFGDRTSKYTYTWVSDGSGDVSGDTTTIVVATGDVVRIEIVPNGGGTQPTDLYDLTLLDSHGVDMLDGQAANLSNSAAAVLFTSFRVDSSETFQLVIANAGNAKGGTLKLWVSR